MCDYLPLKNRRNSRNKRVQCCKGDWKEQTKSLFQICAAEEHQTCCSTCVLINQSDWHRTHMVSNIRTKQKNENYHCFTIFTVLSNTKTIITITPSIKYTLGKSWYMTFFFFIHNHKILNYFNYETKSKFLILKSFPSCSTWQHCIEF